MEKEQTHFWKQLSRKEISDRINLALSQNQDFHNSDILGVPASQLDPKVFNNDASFLQDAPFLKRYSKTQIILVVIRLAIRNHSLREHNKLKQNSLIFVLQTF